MTEATWLLFIVASLVLIATPGQDMILVMSRSIAQGPVAGMLSGWLRSRPQAPLWLFRSSGTILVGLGIRLALESRQ